MSPLRSQPYTQTIYLLLRRPNVKGLLLPQGLFLGEGQVTVGPGQVDGYRHALDTNQENRHGDEKTAFNPQANTELTL